MTEELQQDASDMRREVLLTGVTGFVGKVVLESMMRRRHELGIERVHVLIRGSGERSARERFESEVKASRCFWRLPDGWCDHVEVVEGDIARERCGLSDPDRRRLTGQITHIMHLAASVDFNLPLREALDVNAHGCLNVLDVAKDSPRLERMVAASTAYVTAHPGNGRQVGERLAPLPRPAIEIHADIIAGRAQEKALLRETGHPNTYTLTKCLAEHLLVERRGHVPLSLIRPSIISGSVRDPMPGWIDSTVAFAGFVVLVGTGCMRAVACDPDLKVDIVPVDVVAASVVEAAFEPQADASDPSQKQQSRGDVEIRHVVAGLEHCPTAAQCRDSILDYFRRHPVAHWPRVDYLGPAGPRFALADTLHHSLRLRLGALLTGRGWRAGNRMVRRVSQLNATFRYFLHHTFDFAAARSTERPEPRRYLDTVVAGVHAYLLGQGRTEVPLAGRRGPDRGGDLRFALRQPAPSWTFRVAAWLVTRSLRRMSTLVTLDVESFERARRAVPDGSRIALAPSHRSYLDFVLCSYLCFARPDLGLAIPRVAAAHEFSRIPVVSRMLVGLHAFWLKRGVGREDASLTRTVHSLVRDGETLEFFIEGTRSRSRRFLQPRRGFLRALQGSEEQVTLLPIAISYDRVPEERSFTRELAGEEKPRMRLSDLLVWTARMVAGRVRIGRVHIAAGAPVVLERDGDASALGRQVVAELQRATTVSTAHLSALQRSAPELGLDVDELAACVRLRGGPVLEGAVGAPFDPDSAPVLATMRRQLEPLFYPELRERYGEHAVIAHHLRRNDHVGAEPQEAALEDPNGEALLRAIFGPVCRDYLRVAMAVDELAASGQRELPSPRAFVRAHGGCEIDHVEAAYDELLERGIIESSEAGFALVANTADMDWRSLYEWPGRVVA